MSLEMLGTPGDVALNGLLTYKQHAMQTPSVDESLLVWTFKLLWDVLRRKQHYFSFLQSKRNNVLMRTSCCTVGYRHSQAGGIRSSREWELPAGSSVTKSC